MHNHSRIADINLVSRTRLPSPKEIRDALPSTETIERAVLRFRGQVRDIIDGKDPRLIIVVGPCSVHDVEAALDYADRLEGLQSETEDVFLTVMRVYFEKPRTTVGWKGLINDPDMDDSFHMEKGIRLARSLLHQLASRGLPAATEALDPIIPQYLGDLVTWTAIGARTTESQTHREMASGLSTPVGFKNGTDGAIETAINALRSAREPHHFLGIDEDGAPAVFRTAGNRHGHVILRGGRDGSNYDSVHVALSEDALAKAGLAPRVMIDCSHANSNKNHELQPLVLHDGIEQLAGGNRSIIGFMLESHINAGNQPIPADLAKLKYGVSVTDACIDWATTAATLRKAAADYRKIMPTRRLKNAP
jgi:3-deoxy-7-phosphoheptulonate synthase